MREIINIEELSVCCVNSYFHRKHLSSEQKQQKHRLEERKYRDTSRPLVRSPVSCYLLISCARVLEKG